MTVSVSFGALVFLAALFLLAFYFAGGKFVDSYGWKAAAYAFLIYGVLLDIAVSLTKVVFRAVGWL